MMGLAMSAAMPSTLPWMVSRLIARDNALGMLRLCCVREFSTLQQQQHSDCFPLHVVPQKTSKAVLTPGRRVAGSHSLRV